MSNENGKIPRENGKGKGLGWIPEYPDLRDYGIGNEETLRFKIEEKIAEDLILLIESLNLEDKGFGFQGDNKERQRQIDDFKNEVLGNVKFIKVKVHKIFRYPSLQEGKPINRLPDKNSLFIQQILELKKYLYIIVTKDNGLQKKYEEFYEKQHQKIEDTGYKITNFNDDKEIVNWMRQEDYDLTTIIIVKFLQNYFKIREDGIFGLNTYTKLNKHFSGKYNLLPPPIESDISHLSSNQKSLSQIRFVSIASFISNIALDKILDILIKEAIESIYIEYLKYCEKLEQIEEKEKMYNEICEYDFLENKIKVPKENKLFFKRYLRQDLRYIINLIDKHHEKKDLEYIISLIEEASNDSDKDDENKSEENREISKGDAIKNKVNDIDKDNEKKSEENKEINKGDAIKNKLSDDFWSYINNNDGKKSSLRYEEIIKALRYSYLIEPIFSSVLNILSPLAQDNNQNFEELIEQGLKKFENILLCQQSPNDDLQICEAAVEKVLYLLGLKINSLLEQQKDLIGRDQHKYTSHIFLCFLITKYLKKFPEQINKYDNIKKYNIPNIFDKQEVFEIDYRADLGRKDSELFPSLEISIPIVGNDIVRQFKSNLRDKSEKQLYSHLPGVIDLSFWCSPVRDQGSLNSCSAFAVISLFEYFVNKNLNKNVDASPLFLYKAARNKMNLAEDVGASIRETMKALALYGVPPEDSWSYDENKVNEEPPAYCYAYAQNYQSLKYFLLDYAGIPKETLLFQIKAVLAASFPCVFGFTIYNSIYEESNELGHIPFPDPERDKVIGGHTLVAVGYNDYKFIQCADRKQYSKGAFLIRNSWGIEWGIKGYGWLPYDYVLGGLTAAWWSLIKSEWFNEDNFGLAGSGGEGPDPGGPGDKKKKNGIAD